MLDYDLYHERSLPHIHPRGKALFVTIRSADPIPEKYMSEYRRYKETLQTNEQEKPNDKELKQNNNKKAFAYIDDMFHRSNGEISFTDHESVATMISENIQALEGNLCQVYAYTIMPNHLHLLLRPAERDGKPIALAEIMMRFKGISARQVNLILNRSGSLWYREYYDHWVRNEKEFVNIVEYIRQNPVKAGLVNDADRWRWTGLNLGDRDGV
ncbi:MAG: transposase [Candidatus Cloacimonadaceae bacterium]|nr:transposase [Candidatus Cloacimonadaceae bacterium]